MFKIKTYSSVSSKQFILCVFILFLLIMWNITSFGVYDELTIKNMESKKRFYVNSSKCQMPYVEPFNTEFTNLYTQKNFTPCSNQSDLITVNFDSILNHYVLHVNKEVLHKLSQSNSNDFACFYQNIIYGQSADHYDRMGNRTKFTHDYVVPLNVEGMLVECRSADEKRILQEDAFTFVQHQKSPPNSERDRKASVIMYGIDTVSRTNLRRLMPMVFEFLKSPGWYEMMGYNKVADNSFPNIFAVLTGYSPHSAVNQICDASQPGCLDKIPFIWKEMQREGYLTAYAEDSLNINTFNYLKPGFFRKPTDYYFRPLLDALEKETFNLYCPSCKMKYCLGRRLVNSYIFDYCRQFMQRFVAKRPIWGMFWSTHFSHDDFTMLSAMQHKVLGDLLNFEKDGSFEHTIMIFFSDHGSRYGPLMATKESFLEGRQPMMFIYLPPWFRIKYPHYVEALAQNQNRLSSNFDVYNTLKHIINIEGLVEHTKWSYDCPQCQSLFYPLPETRSCSEAGIPEAYCTCHNYEEVQEDRGTWRMAELVVDRINQYLQYHNLQSLCSNLTLRVVNVTEVRMLENDEHVSQGKGLRNYHTKFQVHQNLAQFFATVLYDRRTEELQINVELISRINRYRTDAECLDDSVKKLYCICLSNIRNNETILTIQ
ncbi:uncharacterized protein LOC6527812 [Drosophila yakuba]|uniref:Uncharacterized protein n=1 Tax=Drosophila yakuba TaxID=7245 RepID=B4NXK6_DROYA|nr:uncharacterized protein LOC6527812 [Drosophila yakuba]EDW88597.2 uncharacterized protein Dyak_GE18813 [Drosophila yakuba]